MFGQEQQGVFVLVGVSVEEGGLNVGWGGKMSAYIEAELDIKICRSQS